MHMLLPANHVASPGAVNTLPCVHVHCLEVLREACPSIAAGHWLLSKVICPYCQGPGDEISNWLFCIMVSHLKPNGEAHDITRQGDLAMLPFLVLGGVWQ